MSPVVHAQDGVAYPDTLVGTDSHTPHVDALGVIAIGVGGLEAENVMLGRASWMRLPDIIGVELSGRPGPGITATDVVLTLTEFLRKEKVVGAYLEFYGAGAAALTLGDRATISNMAPEYGATAAMFAIDQQTIDYLRLTGREDEQIALVETYAKTAGLWADSLTQARYERVLRFDLSTVVRTLAGPSNPHRRLPVADCRARHRRQGREPARPDARRRRHHRRHHQLHQHQQPAQRYRRRPAGAQRQPRRAHAQALGQELAGARLQGRRAVPDEAGLTTELEQLGFGVVAFACTTCNGMSGALDPKIQQEIIDRDLYSTAVLSGNRNFDGRIHPYAKQAFLASPPLVVAYAIAGTIRFDIERDVLGTDASGREIRLKNIWPTDAEIDAVVKAAVKPEQFRKVYAPMFGIQDERRAAVDPLYPGAHRAPTSAARRTGKARWPARARCAACARWPCWATTSPPTTCRRPTPS